jgi:hypothetical protein
MTTKLEERIEELARDLIHEQESLGRRIEAIEKGTLPVDPREPADQVLHQDRWHATFNAFVAGVMTQATHASDSETAYSAATAFADRVHGPLMVSLPAVKHKK